MKKIIYAWTILTIVTMYLFIFFGWFFKPRLYSTYSSPAYNSSMVCHTYVGMEITVPDWLHNNKIANKILTNKKLNWHGAGKANDEPWNYFYLLKRTQQYDCKNLPEDNL